MKRLHFARPRAALGSAIAAAVLALGCSTASADLVITNVAAADEKTITDPGGCGANGCIPLGTTGYIVSTSAPGLVVTAGVYKFTYLGAGDSVDDNKFAIAGGGTFCSQAFAGCNGGVPTPIGTSFTMTLSAGAIPFVFTASPDAGTNGPRGCVLTDGSTSNAQPNTGCADYFVALPSGKVGSTGWHSDKSFRPEPSLATILHAQIMPPEGGETRFANMIAAYDALLEATRTAVDSVRIVHSWELSRARLGLQATPEEIADAPPLTHPLVRTIPETGQKALFMGEHASHVEGRPMAEGRALLDALTAHAVEERFVYRHKWRAGDMLMWDNRCLLHRANANFDAARFPRVLHRTCLRGSAPA